MNEARQIMATVTENARLCRFELVIDEEAMAAAYYQIRDGLTVLVHTEVPQAFSGQGYGSLLVRGALELLRRSGRQAVPQCPFIARFVLDHPEYTDVIVTRSIGSAG